MKYITAQELKVYIDSNTPHQLIDVREPYEYDIVHINGLLIPMENILNQVQSIRPEIPVIIHCKSGKRAEAVVETLERKHHLQNLYILKGGIEAYINEIAPHLPCY
jgi:rhodanese-related sulfurtransferase